MGKSISDELRAVGIESFTSEEMSNKYGVNLTNAGSLPDRLGQADLERILKEGEGKVGGTHFEVWRGAGKLVQIRAYDGENKHIASYNAESGIKLSLEDKNGTKT